MTTVLYVGTTLNTGNTPGLDLGNVPRQSISTNKGRPRLTPEALGRRAYQDIRRSPTTRYKSPPPPTCVPCGAERPRDTKTPQPDPVFKSQRRCHNEFRNRARNAQLFAGPAKISPVQRSKHFCARDFRAPILIRPETARIRNPAERTFILPMARHQRHSPPYSGAPTGIRLV
jgi:hypothetical protein